MIFEHLKEQYPYFYKASEYLEKNCAFFTDVLAKIKEFNPDYAFAEKICRNAFIMSGENWDVYYKNLHRLIANALEFLKLQMELEREGRYHFKNYQEVEQYSYQHPELSGPQYMWELYFSQIFWLVHQKILAFFKNDFLRLNQKIGLVLEIPVGTGIYLSEFLLMNSNWRGVGVDIGDSAIDFAGKVFASNHLDPARYMLVKKDFREYVADKKFDRIICGEFLEHLDDPLSILKKMYSLLATNGKIFITVAVWAAMIDHIYLYKNVQEVRDQLHEVGFKIEKELAVNVFDTAKNNRGRIPQVYCAILTK